MAVRINASGEFLNRTASLPSSTNFTLCGWANLTRRASAFQYWGLEDGSDFLVIGYQDTGGEFQIFSGASNNFGSSPSAGTWFFYAITCAGTGGTDFVGYWAAIGAASFNTVSALGVSFTPNALYIGSDSFDEYVDGLFAYQKVYDAVLTSDELLREMYTGLPLRTGNLHAFWPMFPGSGERTRDYSGNGKDLSEGGTLTDEAPPPISYGAPFLTLPFTAAAAGLGPTYPGRNHPSKNILLRL